MEQGVEIYKVINKGSTVPIYWQRQLPPNASYLNVVGYNGKATHMILPLPFDGVRQLVCLHEYGHLRETQVVGAYIPDEFLKKPKLAYKKKSVYSKMLFSELYAWNFVMTRIAFCNYQFDIKDIDLTMNEWGISRYLNDFGKPDKACRARIKNHIYAAGKFTPEYLLLPSTQKILSDVSS